MLGAYERWAAATPMVTRGMMVSVVIAYIVSFFLDLELALGNIPYYTIMRFEVYRILLSFLVGNSFLSLIMIALFFPSMAGRMENSIGSSGLLTLMGSVMLLTNISFDLCCLLLSFMGTSQALFWSCNNFWLIVFGLITIECMQVAVIYELSCRINDHLKYLSLLDSRCSATNALHSCRYSVKILSIRFVWLLLSLLRVAA